MRHPAAPTLVAALLGLLLAVLVWNRWRREGHHEGNPHPDDVPAWVDEDGEGEAGDSMDGEEQ
ncbi:hypothetical protein K505DRAFT_327598 [Melanomma pulvis-pyrius CBS 109.77]|uniref:Uncharacterized protein n=1 Tax=Melanomma pulvis-pyrius CBS 109.77 TaxID=1314802 RepID=A0A6A6X223_9PLEO|nr:hypothetical protein K505DRAFT_327598 [Melanomma pulvis-pyrius CBS 109.77]